jgi:methyltransferase-like protein 6
LCSGSKNITVYACDCSSDALVRTKENIDRAISSVDNFHSFCCDFSTSEFPDWVACDRCRDKFMLNHSGFGLSVAIYPYTLFSHTRPS